MIECMLAAPSSGSGKTALACALLAALQKRGLAPCAFKCGPDYIDPMFHRSVLGVESHNLDLFLCGEDAARTLYARHAAGHGAAACERSIHSWDEADSAQILRSFVFDTCKAQANWNMKNFISDQVELIRQQVGDRKVLLALSGGVDSSVVAALLIKAIGKQLTCVHVNHGLMRKGESESVIDVFKNQMDANLVYVDAVDRFLGKLAGVADPEQKRKIIGAEFIRVFEE